MVWIAVVIGLASFAVLARSVRRLPCRSIDPVERAFRIAAGAGLSVLAAVAVYEGAPVGALVAAVASAGFAVDAPAAARALRPAQSSTVTPFQKAT
jgi:hypothetical protein